jgi:CHASE3 domain sensor protein
MVNTFKRNILLGLGISLAALIISSAASYISIGKLVDSESWVAHTSKVIQGLDNINSRIKDAETGQRGFLLTGDDVFLDPYKGSKEDVMSYFDTVQLLTADNAAQQKDFPSLEKLIHQKFEFIDKTIADKRRGIPPTFSTLLAGKSIMDQIRTKINAMEKREQQLMVTRTSKMNLFATYTPLLILLASLIAVVVTYMFYRRMKNNLLDNQRLQEELERKEDATGKQIREISELADKIAKGNYEVRIENDKQLNN